MLNPNRDTSEEVLQQLKEASYERFRTQFATAVEQKLIDFEMTWDDLAKQLDWKLGKFHYTGTDVKQIIKAGGLSAEGMNDIAHVFSCESYIILRPRNPWVQT